MSKYGKPIASVLVGTAFALYLAFGASSPGGAGLTIVEKALVALAVAQAVQTYIVPLAAQYPWSKTAAGAVLAAAQAVVTVLGDGWQIEQDIFVILFAAAGALGIAVAPARSDNGVRARFGVGDTVYGPPYGDRGSATTQVLAPLGVLALLLTLAVLVATRDGADAAPVKPRPPACDNSKPTQAPHPLPSLPTPVTGG